MRGRCFALNWLEQDTSRLLEQAKTQQVDLFGTTAQIDSFLTSGSPRSRNASCMDASIFLLRGIDPVADGHAYHGDPREHTRHKMTTH